MNVGIIGCGSIARQRHAHEYGLLADDFPVLDIVEFELLSVSEMLEYLPVFISDCDSHC